jgi:hypothetical protein
MMEGARVAVEVLSLGHVYRYRYVYVMLCGTADLPEVNFNLPFFDHLIFPG